MTWEQTKDNAELVGARFKERWVKLSDDDLRLVGGSKTAFIQKLAARTGVPEIDAEIDLDGWLTRINVKK